MSELIERIVICKGGGFTESYARKDGEITVKWKVMSGVQDEATEEKWFKQGKTEFNGKYVISVTYV